MALKKPELLGMFPKLMPAETRWTELRILGREVKASAG